MSITINLLPTDRNISVFHFENANTLQIGYEDNYSGDITMNRFIFNDDFTAMHKIGIGKFLPIVTNEETYQPSDMSIHLLSNKFNSVFTHYVGIPVINFSLKHKVRKIAISYNGNYLFGITHDNQLVDCYQNKIIMNIESNKVVNLFAVSDDGKFMAISFIGDRNVYLYNIKLKKMFHAIYFPYDAYYISFDKESTRMGVLTFNNIINIYNIKAIHSRYVVSLQMLAISIVDKSSFINTKFISHALHDKNLDKLIARYIY